MSGHFGKLAAGDGRLRFVVYCGLLGLLPALLGAAQWKETSHADFVDGQVDAALYVSRRAELESDSGGVEFFARFDANNDGWYDLITSGDNQLRLFYGPDYSPANCSTFRTPTGSGDCDLADLDRDGWAELIHSGGEVFHGTPTGPTGRNPTVLPVPSTEAVSVYDLDRDGWLDLLFAGVDNFLRIYWGSPDGLHPGDTLAIDIGASLTYNIEIADFDRDGWGDVALSARWTDANPILFWGPNHTWRMVRLPYLFDHSHGLTAADFNHDGWLDLVYSGLENATVSYIYWGSDQGFRDNFRTLLNPGQCYGGSAAFDFNSDNRLDLVYFRGGADGAAPARPIVYLNTGSPGSFSDTLRYTLGTSDLAATGGLAADLNSDGDVDLFVNAWHDSSRILWGPDFRDATRLPAGRDHHGMFREVGNSYDRTPTACYLSSIYDAGPGCQVVAGTSSWIAFEPVGTGVSLAFRSGETPTPDGTWTDFALLPDNGGAIPRAGLGERYLQYRVTFRFDRPGQLPALEEITNELTVAGDLELDVGIERLLGPGDHVPFGATVTPAALVRNYGSATVSFPVRFRIGEFYEDDTVITLTGGADLAVDFTPWTANEVGTHAVLCTTACPNDSNPWNDARRSTVVVGTHDVGAIAIVAPRGTLTEGAVVRPRALVQNFGSSPESFPVEFRIGDRYLWSVDVVDLPPDSVRVITFPTWIAAPDRHTVACSTRLPGDGWPPNDRVGDTIEVVRPSALDAGVEEILVPAGAVDSGASVTPAVVVHNYGTSSATFPVSLRIGLAYREGQELTLPPGTIDTVLFPPWTAEPRGYLAVACTTALLNDSNPDNNQLGSSVLVLVHNVGATAITSPRDSAGEGRPLVPRAMVHNFGNRGESFDVTFRIAPDYRSTVRVEALSPDSAREVEFAAWDAVLGRYAMSCSTELARDMTPADDRITDSFTVVARLVRPLISPDHADSVGPAASIDYLCMVVNAGSADDTVDVEVTLPGPSGNWFHELLDLDGAPLTDQNGNGRPDVGGLAPLADTAWFLLRVTAPEDAPQGKVDSAEVWAMSGYDPQYRSSIRVHTLVIGRLAAVQVTPDLVGRLKSRETRTWSLEVLLKGNVSDRVALRLELNNPRWAGALLDVTGRNPITELGPLEPGAPQPFKVKLTAPEDNPDNLPGTPESLSTCRVLVIGQPLTRPDLADTAVMDFSAVPRLTIHNYENPFHSRTKFIFGLPGKGKVRLYIYNRAGELVRRLVDDYRDATEHDFGVYTIDWNATNDARRKLVPGTYVYVLELTTENGTKTERATGKLMLQ